MENLYICLCVRLLDDLLFLENNRDKFFLTCVFFGFHSGHMHKPGSNNGGSHLGTRFLWGR